ncbi:MAG: lipase [Chloroflexi bacterium]|nr:lipase [Chloroflexota bacterium]
MNHSSLSTPHNPVVMAPGYRDDASVFARFVDYLRGQNFNTFPMTLAPSDGRVPLEALASQVSDFVEQSFAPEQRLDFVGFSMGGVVLRYYLQRLGGLARAQRFVTLGTPHRGTWIAYGSNRPGVRQMRPGSAFLRNLAEDADRLGKISFTSIWTPLDLTIVPARSSAIDVGRHERVRIPHHRALVTNRRSLERVAAALRETVGQWDSGTVGQ